MITVTLWTVAVVAADVVVVEGLDTLLGLGLDHLLLSPPSLLAVLQVLLPLVPGPEPAHLDLTLGVVIRADPFTTPFFGYLLFSLSQQESSRGSPGNVSTSVWANLRKRNQINNY